MPAAIAIPLAIGAGTAAAGVVGAKLQSGAATDAADINAQAANHAADVQAQSAANTLAFNQQQAQQAFNNAQAAQQGNYNQWAAKEGRLSTLGQMVGSKPFDIPAYVPLQQAPPIATSTGTSNASPSSGGTQNPNVTTMGAALNPTATNSQTSASTAAPAGMITLRNQYGQMKQVPQGQASVWQGLGYQVVG